jgi:hypothetical protein
MFDHVKAFKIKFDFRNHSWKTRTLCIFQLCWDVIVGILKNTSELYRN